MAYFFYFLTSLCRASLSTFLQTTVRPVSSLIITIVVTEDSIPKILLINCTTDQLPSCHHYCPKLLGSEKASCCLQQSLSHLSSNDFSAWADPTSSPISLSYGVQCISSLHNTYPLFLIPSTHSLTFPTHIWWLWYMGLSNHYPCALWYAIIFPFVLFISNFCPLAQSYCSESHVHEPVHPAYQQYFWTYISTSHSHWIPYSQQVSISIVPLSETFVSSGISNSHFLIDPLFMPSCCWTHWILVWPFMSGQTIAGDIIVCSNLEHFGISVLF